MVVYSIISLTDLMGSALEHADHCLEVMVKAQLTAALGDTQTMLSTVSVLPYDPDAIYVQRSGRVGHDCRIRHHCGD